MSNMCNWWSNLEVKKSMVAGSLETKF